MAPITLPKKQVVKEIWQVTRICGEDHKVELMPMGFCPCSNCWCGQMEKLAGEAALAKAELETIRISRGNTSNTQETPFVTVQSCLDSDTGSLESSQQDKVPIPDSAENSPLSTTSTTSDELNAAFMHVKTPCKKPMERRKRKVGAGSSKKACYPVPQAQQENSVWIKPVSVSMMCSTILQAALQRRNTKFECAQCDKKYVNRGNFNRHLKTHLPPAFDTSQPAQPACSARTRNKAPIPKQEAPAAETKAPGQIQRSWCSLCQQEFRNGSGLASHLRGKVHLRAVEAAAAAGAAQVHVPAEALIPLPVAPIAHQERSQSDDQLEYSVYPTNTTSNWTVSRTQPAEGGNMSGSSGTQQEESHGSETSLHQAIFRSTSNGLQESRASSDVEVVEETVESPTGFTYGRLRIHVRMVGPREVVDLTRDEAGEEFEFYNVQDRHSSSSSMETSETGTSAISASSSAVLSDTSEEIPLPVGNGSSSSFQTGNSGRLSLSNRPYECCACNSRFEDARARNDHINSHRDRNGQFSCNQCHGDTFGPFKEFAEYAAHIMQLHRTPTIICLQCQRRFTTFARLQQHQRQEHSDDESTSCPKPQTSQRLFRVTPARKRYSYVAQACSWCSKKFGSPNSLKLHVEQLHFNKVSQPSTSAAATTAKCQRSLECPSCSKSYISQEVLIKHMNESHTVVSFNVVPEKNRPKHYRSSRTLHPKAYTGERRGLKRLNQRLDTHQRTHKGENPYECNICSRRFKQRTSMVNHRLDMHSSDDKTSDSRSLGSLTNGSNATAQFDTSED